MAGYGNLQGFSLKKILSIFFLHDKVCIEKKTGPIFVGQGFRKYKQTERMPIFNVMFIEA